MIISKTPFRISFAGGGSDLPSFYQKQMGAVLSTSINKYVYIAMRKLHCAACFNKECPYMATSASATANR